MIRKLFIVMMAAVIICNGLSCYAEGFSSGQPKSYLAAQTNDIYTDYLKYLTETEDAPGYSGDSLTIDDNMNANENIEMHWARDAIITCFNAGMINVTSDGRIRPDDPILRGELAYAFSKWIKKNRSYLESIDFDTRVSTVSFDDIKESTPFNVEIIDVAGRGIIKGYSIAGFDTNGKFFGPDDNLTREQLSVVWLNFLQKLRKGTVNSSYMRDLNVNSFLMSYIDYFTVSDWAKEGVAAMTEQSYMAGYSDGTFRPKGNVTRAEAYSIFYSVEKMLSSHYFYNTAFNYSPDTYYYDSDSNEYVKDADAIQAEKEEEEDERIQILSNKAKKIRSTSFQLQFEINKAANDDDTTLIYGYSRDKLKVTSNNIDNPSDKLYDNNYRYRKVRLEKLNRMYDWGDIVYYINISFDEPGLYYIYFILKKDNQRTEVHTRRVVLPDTDE